MCTINTQNRSRTSTKQPFSSFGAPPTGGALGEHVDGLKKSPETNGVYSPLCGRSVKFSYSKQAASSLLSV